MMFLLCCFFVLGFGWSFDELVFSIDNQSFDRRDLYLKYSRNEWNNSPLSQRKMILTDYLKREGVALEALELGYANDPVVISRLYQIQKQFLINLFYEYSVASPLLLDKDLKLAEKYITKEFFVRHILISHNESELKGDISREIDNAFNLATSLTGNLLGGESFDSLALSFSDDPSVSLNNGALGWIEWGRFVNEFQSAVFESGEPGLLGPIETKYGYHIISVDSVRSSAFSVDSENIVKHEAFSRSLPLVYEFLKPAASAFDSLVLSENLFNLNTVVVDSLFYGLEKQLLINKQVGGNTNLSKYLLNIEEPVLLFSFQGRGFGPFWLGNQLSSLPPSKVPNVSTLDDFKNLIRLFILKDYAYNSAVDLGYLDSDYFLRNFSLEKKRVLYDYYLRDLVNNVPSPDSLEIKNYYEQEKDNKYYNKDQVVIKRLKVSNRALADSLAVLLEKNPTSFDVLVDDFTEYNPGGGGLMGPFERGQYNFIGEVSFSLANNEVSSLIESLDKSFSFVRVEEYFPKTYVPLKNVYKKIDALLLRNKQVATRDSVLNKIKDRHSVVWGEGFKGIVD